MSKAPSLSDEVMLCKGLDGSNLTVLCTEYHDVRRTSLQLIPATAWY